MQARTLLSIAVLGLAQLAATSPLFAQAPPQPQPQPSTEPAPPPPPAWFPPAMGQPMVAPGAAPAQPLTPWGAPQGAPGAGAPAAGPPPGPVVMMPPGYLEQPGQWPRRLPIEEKGDPPPPGYHVSREARRPLWLAGTIIFSVTHAVTGGVAGAMLAGAGEANDALLYIPILGPVIWAPTEDPLSNESGRGLFAGMSLLTAAQGVGFALMVAGFVFKQPAFYRNDVDAKVETGPRPTFGFGPGGLQAGLAF